MNYLIKIAFACSIFSSFDIFKFKYLAFTRFIYSYLLVLIYSNLLALIILIYSLYLFLL